jgi:hypothetical protein
MEIDVESSTISEYPTPTKSKRTSSVFDSISNKPKTVKSRASATKASKASQGGKGAQKSGSKVTKKPTAKSKAQAKSSISISRSSALTNTFKQSKGTAAAAKDIKLGSVATLPSKLRQMDSLPATEPMHAISPVDHRNNGLPLPTSDMISALGAKQFENPMRISSMINS